MEADYTLKQYTSTKPTGEAVVKTISYFDFRLHLLVDTKYELSVLYRVTTASVGEATVAKNIVQHDLPAWVKKRVQTITADCGYDGRPLIAVIDIKNMWRC